MRHSPAHLLYPVWTALACLVAFTAPLAHAADAGAPPVHPGLTAATPPTDAPAAPPTVARANSC